MAQSPVDLHYFAPPEAWRNYFGAGYRFTTAIAPYADATRADVGQLRFMLAGSGNYVFLDGREVATPEICLLGPTMGSTSFRLDEPGDVWGISLLPLGWLALYGGDASRLADDLTDMTVEYPQVYGDMLHELRGLQFDNEASAERIWSFLAEQSPPAPPNIISFVGAVDAWLGNEGSPRIADLVATTGLSDRQVARLTNRLYGAPPKLLARKYRALRCAAKIAVDHTPWQELCEASNFYDQSHFIREIKHFVGLTPHQLMTEPTEVARLTLQRRDLGIAMAEINRIS
ncbi:helix-turn-helix domain-containing protein [Sphingobium sp. SCG-1]|uniref:helix-turn-helix domain-containing protein n=1 Tax=Sphingobium sp. SCG-1 TaxID=2072936 RepID=UPI001CB93D03|nr:AraC family transcriptional regulator [Sphingobium sp. SCG-1]